MKKYLHHYDSFIALALSIHFGFNKYPLFALLFLGGFVLSRKDGLARRFFFIFEAIVTFYLAVFYIVKSFLKEDLAKAATEIMIILQDTNPSEVTTGISMVPIVSYILILLSIFLFASFFKKSEGPSSYKLRTLTTILGLYALFGPHFVFYKIGANLSSGLALIKEEKTYSKLRKNFSWEASQDDRFANRKQTYVIVLGETARGDRMSINGYKRDTNPLLSQEEIITFKNAISNAPFTLRSTPIILSRKDIRDKVNSISEKSIFGAFNETGFETYYISYLTKVHTGDNAINQISGEAKHYVDRPTNYDDAVIPVFKKILDDDSHKKKFIIFKMIGSHFLYHTRYPKEFEYFKPSHSSVPYASPTVDDLELLNNSFDNSIRFTDHVVSRIINLLKEIDGPSYLAFISDHGSSIFDDKEKKSLYGGRTKANYSIPLFFWFNDNYKNLEEAKPMIKALSKNQDLPVDSTLFLDTIFNLSFLKTSKYRGASLLKVPDNFKREVITSSGDVVDYDKDIE